MTTKGSLWLAATAGLLCLAAWMGLQRWEPVLAGLGIAFILILISFWSLCWAFHRSNRFFFTVYAAGFFGRLAGFIATAYLTWRYFRLDFAAVLLSLAAGLLVLSWVESFYIHKRASS